MTNASRTEDHVVVHHPTRTAILIITVLAVAGAAAVIAVLAQTGARTDAAPYSTPPPGLLASNNQPTFTDQQLTDALSLFYGAHRAAVPPAQHPCLIPTYTDQQLTDALSLFYGAHRAAVPPAQHPCLIPTSTDQQLTDALSLFYGA